MNYAVIKSGGKQYRVTEGQVLEVERLVSDGKEFVFSDVLMVASDNAYSVGTPTVAGVSVKAKVLGDVRGEKIKVSKFKSKVRYRKTTGHRQALTRVHIESIGSGVAKKTAGVETKPAKTRKKVAK